MYIIHVVNHFQLLAFKVSTLPLGHRKHRPDEKYDIPTNILQHWWKVNKLSVTACPPQYVVRKQTGAIKYIAKNNYIHLCMHNKYTKVVFF